MFCGMVKQVEQSKKDQDAKKAKKAKKAQDASAKEKFFKNLQADILKNLSRGGQPQRGRGRDQGPKQMPKQMPKPMSNDGWNISSASRRKQKLEDQRQRYNVRQHRAKTMSTQGRRANVTSNKL